MNPVASTGPLQCIHHRGVLATCTHMYMYRVLSLGEETPKFGIDMDGVVYIFDTDGIPHILK